MQGALGEKQTLNPVDVLHALGHKRPALPTDPAAVFLFGRRRFYHGTHPRFAALVGQQRADQRLAVDLVSLRPPAPARSQDRSGDDLMAFDSLTLQHAMDPEAVQAG